MANPTKTLIETIDTRQLPHLQGWSILPIMYPQYVEDLEVEQHLRALLATGKFRLVRVEPHLGADGNPEPHLLDIYELEGPASETPGD